MGRLLPALINIVFIRTGHFTCGLWVKWPHLLCLSSCRLDKSWYVQPKVNGIPSNRRLAIVSARWDVCGATNSTWSDIFIESTCMRYGPYSQGGLRQSYSSKDPTHHMEQSHLLTLKSYSTEHLTLSVQNSLICMSCSLTIWHHFRHHCS